MPKYKVGDKVVLRKDLNTDDLYSMEDGEESDVVCPPMIEISRCHGFVTIDAIEEGEYQIVEDRGDWSWTDGMIAGLYKEGA